MLWGGPVATVRSRDFFVNYPVSFSLRYLYIRPISRTWMWLCMSVICMSECVKRVTRSEFFGNFLLLSRVSSSALIVHSVVCMSVILYGRDSFCTVVTGDEA